MFLFIVGVAIVAALYFELHAMIYLLSAMMMFEAVTNVRLTTQLQKIRNIELDSGLVVFRGQPRLRIDAERAWRFLVALVLLGVYAMLHEFGYDMLWFFPWFLGFAIMGAGVSGVCPMQMGLRWVGFK